MSSGSTRGGYEPDDAPCIMPEKRRAGGGSSSAGERNPSSYVRPAPRPPSEDEEQARNAGALPAAGVAGGAKVKADAKDFDREWASMYQRVLATTSIRATCDGIQNGSACCGATCGECGGPECFARGNGAEYCCREDILDSGVLCSDTGGAPPCIVDDESEPLSPGPDATPVPFELMRPSSEPPETRSPETPETPSPEAFEPTSSPATPNTWSPETLETASPKAFGPTPSPETPDTRPPAMPATESPETTPSPQTRGMPETMPPTAWQTSAPAISDRNRAAPTPVEPPTHPSLLSTPPPSAKPTPAASAPAQPTPPPTTPLAAPVAVASPAPSSGNGGPMITPPGSATPPPTPQTNTPLSAPVAMPSPAPSSADRRWPGYRGSPGSPTSAPSSGRAAAPALAPLAPGDLPSAAPSMAGISFQSFIATSSAAPTGVPTAAATAAEEEFGFFGPGFISGSFSAKGISDDVLASLGEEGIIRQVVCELAPCPGGGESVQVGGDAAAQLSGRRLSLSANPQIKTVGQRGQGQHQAVRREGIFLHPAVHGGGESFLRGEHRKRQSEDEEGDASQTLGRRRRLGRWRRRRRLVDVEDVSFSVPSIRGIESEGGEAMTGSKQAAATINAVADPVVMARIAAGLSLDVKDLDFANLAFSQNNRFPIEKDFDVGFVEFSNVYVEYGLYPRGIDGDESDPGMAGTGVLALCLVALVAIVGACLCCCRERKGRDKRGDILPWLGSPVVKHHGANVNPTGVIVMANFDEEGDVDLSEDEVDYEYDVASLARSGGGQAHIRRFRSSQVARSGRRHHLRNGGVEMVGSAGSESDSDDDRVTQGQTWKKNGSQRSVALAQHYYDGGSLESLSEASSRSASSGNRVFNPIFDQGNNQPWSRDVKGGQRQSHHESEQRRPSYSKPEKTKPVARIAKRPPSFSRTFSFPELSPVVETDPVVSPVVDRASGDPRLGDPEDNHSVWDSDLESDSESEETKMVEGVATSAPRSSSGSFPQPDLSPVTETDLRRRGESGVVTTSSFSTRGSPRAGGRDGDGKNRSRSRGSGPPDASIRVRGVGGDGANHRVSAGGPHGHCCDTAAGSILAEVVSRPGGSSPVKSVRPPQPLLGGESPASGCSSRSTGSRLRSRAGSFVSSFSGASSSSLDSSLADEGDGHHSAGYSVDSGIQDRG